MASFSWLAAVQALAQELVQEPAQAQALASSLDRLALCPLVGALPFLSELLFPVPAQVPVQVELRCPSAAES